MLKKSICFKTSWHHYIRPLSEWQQTGTHCTFPGCRLSSIVSW